jgi:hypothetical protein
MADKLEEKVKRKPGRPRKKPLKEPTKRSGIMESPDSDDNIVEFLYDQPSNFKKICSYWSALNADKIKFVFTQSQLVLYTKDYKETNDVGITCDGAKLNKYYCEKPITIGVAFSNLELVLSKLDKSYETISFVLQRKTQNKTLYCILQNDVNIPEFFEIDIIIDPQDQEFIYQQMFQNQIPYALEFKLPGKYFKKAICDAKQFEKQWTIEKFGDTGNLMFTYKSSNGQVKATAVPKNLRDIGLRSSVGPKEIFSVSVYIDTLKPTSSSLLADTINIRASKDRPLWIWADLDEKAIMVNVLIKIVDHRAPVPPPTPNK